MMNVRMTVKNQINGVLVKMIICRFLERVIASAIRPVKLMNIQMFLCMNNFPRGKFIFGKLAILKTTENLIIKKKYLKK